MSVDLKKEVNYSNIFSNSNFYSQFGPAVLPAIGNSAPCCLGGLGGPQCSCRFYFLMIPYI